MKDSKKVTKKTIAVKNEDNFIDEENDNRVIIFIAIAILVIIGTIIGLLVGCEKKEEEDPVKKPQEDIIIPVEKNEDEEEKKTTVKKVTTKSSEEESYVVLFNLLDEDDVQTVEVKNGKVSPYVPKGYNSCKYYVDENLTKEFDFTKKITQNTTIYTSCSIALYTIIYDKDTNSQKEYDLKEGKVTLKDAILETGFFEGWYTTPDFSGEKVEYLSKNLAKIANEDNEIYLYAKTVDSYTIEYYNQDGSTVGITKTYESQKSNPVKIWNLNALIPEGKKLLGYSTSQGSNIIEYYPNQEIIIDRNLKLYKVIGNATVIYESEGETVTVGMTTDELKDYELPSPEEIGFETPTYLVKVDKTNENTKEIVPDEVEELLDNQIKLSEAQTKAGENETLEVGDSVEEKEKVFDGWMEETTNEETGETELNEIDETYKPEDNEDNKLVANWKEQDDSDETVSAVSETELETAKIENETVETETIVEEAIEETQQNDEINEIKLIPIDEI